IMRARYAGVKVVETPVRVVYPARERRTTHYRGFVDTVRIVYRVHATFLVPWLKGPREDGAGGRRWALVLAAVAAVLAMHPALLLVTRMTPPPVDYKVGEPIRDIDHGALRLDGDYARHRGKIWEVSLHGSPEEIGARQVRLMYPEMLANESQLWDELRR